MDFLDLLTAFVEKEMPQYEGKTKEIKYALAGHYQFGTLDFDADDRGITYLLRLNINGEVANVLDLCVRKDLRRKINIKRIILKNWSRFPMVKRFTFSRLTKYPYKKQKEYELEKVIKE